MKGVKLLFLVVAVSMCLSFAPSATMAQKPIVLRMAHWMADNKLLGAEHFVADEMFKRSNGAVKIETYFGGTLGKGNELLGLVKDGSIDIACIAPGYYPSQLPLWNATNNLPFVMREIDTVLEAANRLSAEVPGVREEMEAQNVKFLFSEPLLHYAMFAKKPAVTFEDLKGMKIRSYGVYLPQIFKVAGAVGVTMYAPETYEALKRNVIDASVWPLGGGYFMKNHEVAPHVCLWDIMSICGYNHFINIDVWNKLPEDVKKLMLEVYVDANKNARERYVWRTEEAKKGMVKDGATVYPIADSERKKWIDACPNFMDQWVESCEKIGKGEAARQMKDLWLQIIAKYDK